MKSIRTLAIACGMTCASFLGVGLRAEEAAETRPTLPPYITQRTALAIPFSLRDGQGENQPVEVQVFISFDRGGNWNFLSRHRPEEGEFQFRARRDGEYWLATRTIDRAGRAVPAGPLVPQLRLVVDTAPPKLDLAVEANAAGELQIAWQAADEMLDPSTLTIAYQDAATQGAGLWETVAADVPTNVAAGATIQGDAACQPQTKSRAINVRATIRDKAKNVTTVDRQVFLPRGAGGPAATPPTNAAPVDPLAKTPPSLPTNPLLKPAAPTDANKLLPPVAANDGGERRAADVLWPAKPQPPVSTAPPLLNSPGRLASAGAGGFPPTNAPPSTFDASPPANENNAAGTPPQPAPAAERPPTEDWLANERPRLTNSRRFHLEYDVESLAPENLSDVELWGTNDGGRAWARWGSDTDRTSPFEVEVGSETTYGFRIVVVTKNGVASRPPQGGDAADVWVTIDQTAPTARITQAAYGVGERAGQLDIRWEASDRHLGSRPVTLAFADRPDGPFTTIAAGLPNDGQYWWPFDPRTPRKIYLRLEVRDDAGNVGTHQLPEPLSVEGLAPRGRIRGITPTDGATQGAFRSPLFR
jgi:hypothetical protein